MTHPKCNRPVARTFSLRFRGRLQPFLYLPGNKECGTTLIRRGKYMPHRPAQFPILHLSLSILELNPYGLMGRRAYGSIVPDPAPISSYQPNYLEQLPFVGTSGCRPHWHSTALVTILLRSSPYLLRLPRYLLGRWLHETASANCFVSVYCWKLTAFPSLKPHTWANCARTSLPVTL